jgi:hypothetical protein
MAYVPPIRQRAYEDTGRRQIDLLGRKVLASLVALKEADARTFQASHELFIDRIPGVTPQQIMGQIIDFDGELYQVKKVMDPKASDPTMRGRYLRMISVKADRP